MSVQALSVPTGGPSIMIRRAKPEDAPVCGRVCYEAFYKISTDHGFPPDFPSLDVAISVLSMMFSRPGFYCVVAESDGCMVGSNCLDERSGIAGLGPITVDPSIQNRGVGRQLLEAVLVRARERNFSGVRLLQSAFHNRSLALIASAEAFAGPGIIVPTRNSGLFRWCLENGLRVVQPMTLMTLGLYNEPAGAYLPSILF
jgi:GNAT superfamily N-acetyltransferase